MRHLLLPGLPDRAGERVQLEGPVAARLRTVLRLGDGAPLVVCDGRGRTAPARLEIPNTRRPERAQVWLRLEADPDQAPAEPEPRITLGVPILKGPRFDWLVEKATELGAAALQPVRFARGVVRADDVRLDRLRALVAEACEQSGRRWAPTVSPPCDLEALIAEAAGEPIIALHPGPSARPLAQIAAGLVAPSARWWILSGPEGGLEAQEVETLTRMGARVASLGSHILRAETAALAALAVTRAHLDARRTP